MAPPRGNIHVYYHNIQTSSPLKPLGQLKATWSQRELLKFSNFQQTFQEAFGSILSRTLMHSRRALGITEESGVSGSPIVFQQKLFVDQTTTHRNMSSIVSNAHMQARLLILYYQLFCYFLFTIFALSAGSQLTHNQYCR